MNHSVILSAENKYQNSRALSVVSKTVSLQSAAEQNPLGLSMTGLAPGLSLL